MASFIKNEFLEGYPNFRYKKVNILMGGNATGKTTFGKVLMNIFNFIQRQNIEGLAKAISEKSREALFQVDFVITDVMAVGWLYRVYMTMKLDSDGNYNSNDIHVEVRNVKINRSDNYETSIKRLENREVKPEEDYLLELKKVQQPLSWRFMYPTGDISLDKEDSDDDYLRILNTTLRTLDPAILRIEQIEEAKDSYVIKMKNQNILIQEGEAVKSELLSSGTKNGIDIATLIYRIQRGGHRFYYCDEKFTFIHSDVEKSFLCTMICLLRNNNQLFFTTHNSDILDLPLPKHSFTFMKKELVGDEYIISCISADTYLKRNTDSLKNAVENDLFSIIPDTSLLDELHVM